jgi:hypothetical protein
MFVVTYDRGTGKNKRNQVSLPELLSVSIEEDKEQISAQVYDWTPALGSTSNAVMADIERLSR